jgi:hypothetical protein
MRLSAKATIKRIQKTASVWAGDYAPTMLPLLGLIALAAVCEVVPVAREWRARHPFGSLGAAFIAGVALAAAKSPRGEHCPPRNGGLT